MTYQGGSYRPSHFPYLGPTETEDFVSADSPGGLVLPFQSAVASLLIGDVVFLTSTAFRVNKSNTPADYQNFVGVVVGGKSTDWSVLQEDSAVGLAACSAIGDLVLVGILGKFKVVSDAAITAGAVLTVGAVTAGRVDDSASATAGQKIGNALEAATGAAEKILMLVRHR